MDASLQSGDCNIPLKLSVRSVLAEQLDAVHRIAPQGQLQLGSYSQAALGTETAGQTLTGGFPMLESPFLAYAVLLLSLLSLVYSLSG